MRYRQFKPRKPKKYRIYYRKSSWKPTKKVIKGWKYAKKSLEWFKSKNIKAYAKCVDKKKY